MNQLTLNPTSAKDLVLATAALCGELSPLAASRLVPSQSYRYHVLEDLVKSKLLRPYRRDKVKGYRLTRQAKNRLAEQSPDRYAALFSGSARTNGYASELRARTLLSEFIGRRMAIPSYAGRTAEAILMGDSMELAPALLQSRGGGRRQLFYLDGTFAQMHYLPNTPQGDALLRLLLDPAAQETLRTALRNTMQPKAQPGNFAFDALDAQGRPVLFAWDFDLVRIQSFALGLGSRGLSGAAIAFDFQANALRRIFGNRVDVRALSFEKTRRLLEI